MRKFKILYIHQYFKFPSDSGGTRSYDLATSFAKAGFEVIVLTSNAGLKEKINQKHKWEIIVKDNIKVYSLRCSYDNNMSFRKRIISFFSFMYNSTIKALTFKDVDLILATSTPLTVGIPAYLKKKINKTPYVFEVRDVWPEVPIKMDIIKNPIIIKVLEFIEKKIYNGAMTIVPLSVGMEKSIKTRCLGNFDKIVTIPNISEINRFSNFENNSCEITFFEKKKTLIYAGTLGRVNGIEYIIDLMHYVQEITSEFVFYIIGSGKEKNDIISYAKEKNVFNKSVFFFNSISKDDLPYVYNKSYMGSSFVIDVPVLWDNSANKFFDTLAAGRPILINHFGWQAETIMENNCGYVLPNKITKDDAVLFVEYLKNEPLLIKQGQNALQLAKEKYSLEIAVKKYLSIFESVN